MPNWCYNTVTIRGPEEQVRKLADLLRRDADGRLQLLERLWPMPEALRGTQAPTEYDPGDPAQRELFELYGAHNWYLWACSERGWGTKWPDCCTEILSEHPGELQLGFNTAWGPPAVGLCNISKVWSDLAVLLTYAGDGFDFTGEMMLQNGKILAERAWEPLPEEECATSEEAADQVGVGHGNSRLEAFLDDF